MSVHLTSAEAPVRKRCARGSQAGIWMIRAIGERIYPVRHADLDPIGLGGMHHGFVTHIRGPREFGSTPVSPRQRPAVSR
jgi:hypothetical protein